MIKLLDWVLANVGLLGVVAVLVVLLLLLMPLLNLLLLFKAGLISFKRRNGNGLAIEKLDQAMVEARKNWQKILEEIEDQMEKIDEKQGESNRKMETVIVAQGQTNALFSEMRETLKELRTAIQDLRLTIAERLPNRNL